MVDILSDGYVWLFYNIVNRLLIVFFSYFIIIDCY